MHLKLFYYNPHGMSKTFSDVGAERLLQLLELRLTYINGADTATVETVLRRDVVPDAILEQVYQRFPKGTPAYVLGHL